MHRRSILTELAIGALGASLIAALAMLFVVVALPAAGAADAPPAGCISVTVETADAAMGDPQGDLQIYRGSAATRFVAAATELFGGAAPPFDPAGITFVVTFAPSDPRIPPQVHFYAGAGNCRIFVATWDPRTIERVARKMAEGQI
jgi:hypothetical protein